MLTANKVIIKLLGKKKESLVGSIYIPTHPNSNSQNLNADRIRFKNALQSIRAHADYDESKLGQSLKKLDKMCDDLEFWKYQDQGLAVLFNSSELEYFKLPFEVSAAVYLTDHFVISPLIIMDALDTSFYVLDLNITAPRLLHSAYGALEEVGKDSMPGSLDDEVGKEEYQKQLQHQHGGGNIAYHGHTEDDVVDDEVRRYLKMIAEVVDIILRDKHAPLLLAGTSNRTGNLRKELKYGFVLDNAYEGSAERFNLAKLYTASADIIQDYIVKRQAESVGRLQSAAPQYVAIGRKEVIDITGSAQGGRIESLYLPIYRVTNDSVQAGDNKSVVIELPKDIETIESLVTAVAEHGGSIAPVEIDAYDFLDRPKALCRY